MSSTAGKDKKRTALASHLWISQNSWLDVETASRTLFRNDILDDLHKKGGNY